MSLLATSGIQGYLAHKKNATPKDPTVGICVGPYGVPRGGGAVSFERGTPVFLRRSVQGFPTLEWFVLNKDTL